MANVKGLKKRYREMPSVVMEELVPGFGSRLNGGLDEVEYGLVRSYIRERFDRNPPGLQSNGRMKRFRLWLKEELDLGAESHWLLNRLMLDVEVQGLEKRVYFSFLRGQYYARGLEIYRLALAPGGSRRRAQLRVSDQVKVLQKMELFLERNGMLEGVPDVTGAGELEEGEMLSGIEGMLKDLDDDEEE